jgi:carboxyl-terminal processing protease
MPMIKTPDKYSQLGYSIVIGVLIGLTLAIVFTAGFFFRDVIDLPAGLPISTAVKDDKFPLLSEVQTLLEHYYLRELPDEKGQQYAAIRGLLSALEDRNTFFIDPPVAQSESHVLAGTYGGIGVHISRNEQGHFILFPFADSPAELAGVEGGDILIEVNGVPVDLETPQDTIDQMMRGEVKQDNGVTLVTEKSTGERFEAFILFDVINVPSVIWRTLPDDDYIGYVQVLRFTSRTPDELNEALQDLTAQDIDNLILDLRNNSGGLLLESITVANAFLADGDIIVYERDNNSERVFRAEGDGLASEIPLVVLINQGTASASELVAGAIQDNNRGILIGQTSFGKGTVQQIYRLSDQSSIHITSAEWLTPNRNVLDHHGLTPNIVTTVDNSGRDVELGEAVRYLSTVQRVGVGQ